MKNYVFYFLLLIACGPGLKKSACAQGITTSPVFHVDLPNPTADKPQSKLWYMDKCWWVVLPGGNGPTLWQRTQTGWKQQPEVSRQLRGIPGRADLWYENRTVTAVGVSDSSLCIFRLSRADSRRGRWHAGVLAGLAMPRENPDIETATIARDAQGVWWVAADVGERHAAKTAIYVWYSHDAVHWSRPLMMQRDIYFDDISCITAVKHGLMVIWSDQARDAVDFRMHADGKQDTIWSPVETVASGGKTADDHINTALSADGTLWVATKNSVDAINRPQLVLRVRRPDGVWTNYPYDPRTMRAEPSRPVVLTTPDRGRVLSGHTIYDKRSPYADRIDFGRVDTLAPAVLVDQTTVIAPDTSVKVKVNNITGPKQMFPDDGPWIILASDEKGNVYESDLKPLFGGEFSK